MKLNISTRITLSILMPIVGIVCLSYLIISEKSQIMDINARVAEFVLLAEPIDEVVHHIQKERGVSAVFVGNRGKKFKGNVDKQRLVVDQYISSLEKKYILMPEDFKKSNMGQQLEVSFLQIKQLKSKRTNIDDLSISTSELLEYYAKLIRNLTEAINLLSEYQTDNETNDHISTYISFINLKERIGRERALSVSFLGSQVVSLDEYQKYVGLLSQQEALTSVVKSTANKKQILLLEAFIESAERKKLDKLRTIILATGYNKIIKVTSSEDYFFAATALIDLAQDFEKSVLSDLATATRNSKSQSQQTYWIAIAFSFAALIAFALFGFILKGVTTPLLRLTQVIKEIASGKNVTVPYQGKQDELGEMAKAIQTFQAHIDERNSLYATVNESKKTYKALLDASSQIMWETNNEGLVTNELPSWQKYTGQSFDDYKGDGCLKAIHIDDQKRVAEKWARALVERSKFETEYRIKRYDGVYRDFLAKGVPILDNDGNTLKWVGTCTDITEIKKVEDQLKQQNFALNESSIVAITDAKGRIIFSNKNFQKISGYSEKELIGQDHRILNSGYHKKEFFISLWKTISSGLVWKGEVCNKNKSGEHYWVDTTIVPFKDTGGRVTQYVAIRNDITSRKKAEHDLIQAKEVAIDAAKTKSEFLANMSHEIRTPMNAIIGMADLLSETDLSRDQKRYVDIFKRAGDSLLSIINDILDISKIDAGHLRLESIDFNLRHAIEDTLEIVASRAYEKKLDVIMNFQNDLFEGYLGDPHRIRQVVSNLITNAVKFTNQGEIRIEVKQNSSAHKGNILIAISDTGTGIPEDKINKLFQSFNQVDNSITRKFGGTGLGLAICKKLVELMGGEIGVKSTVGQGSTFWFTLDIPQSKNSLDERVETSVDLKGVRLLAVDDREANRIILRELLQPWGVSITEAKSGEEAFALAEKSLNNNQIYQLILVDNKMPGGMSGIEFTEKIKQHSQLKNVPVIVFTSDNWSLNQDEAKKIGVFSFLYKPIKRRDLFAEINRALDANSDKRNTVTSHSKNVVLEGFNVRELEILLVDDSDDNRTLFKAYFKNLPHKITEAENGEMAVDKFKEGKFDVVFMDMQMPVLDGYRATKVIRQWEKEHNLNVVPIIALTAYALKEEQEKCLAAGCNSHLSKPIKKQVLFKALAELFETPMRKVG